MAIVFTALIVWAASGIILAALLSRRGHNFWFYAAAGVGYGPLVLLLWLRAARGQPSRTTLFHETDSGVVVPREGWVDILIGLDGTERAVESVRHVLDTLGPAVRRVRLTSVLDHEISNSPDAFEVDERRVDYLEQAAASLGLEQAEISLASGQPDQALSAQAEQADFDLLIVAHRRQRVASALRGSTASRLARNAEMAVLIGPPA